MSRTLFLLVVATAASACTGRPLFEKDKPASELISKDIPGGKFKILATIAGSDGRTDLRMSLNVRTMLNEAGIVAVRKPGRWETEEVALQAICADPDGKVDGVLVVKFTGLRLVDCATNKNAYMITGDPEAGGPGIRRMTQQMINYIQGKKKGTV